MYLWAALAAAGLSRLNKALKDALRDGPSSDG